MNTFILIGEGYYALQVCEIIHLSSQASLLNIITSKNDRILTNWANENQIRIINQDIYFILKVCPFRYTASTS